MVNIQERRRRSRGVAHCKISRVPLFGNKKNK